MKSFFLSACAAYGVAVSSICLYLGLAKDMPALEYAVEVGNQNAELRHRINVFADGTWLLLGNLITIASVAGLATATKRND